MTKPKSFIQRYFWHGIILMVLLGIAANLYIWFAPSRKQATAVTLPSYPIEQVALGRDLYDANCATCHGAAGAGYAQETIPAPAINGTMHAWHHPDSKISGWLRSGVGQMPAVGATLTDDEIDALLSYIKQWWEPEQLAWQTEASRQNP